MEYFIEQFGGLPVRLANFIFPYLLLNSILELVNNISGQSMDSLHYLVGIFDVGKGVYYDLSRHTEFRVEKFV